jgi:hypothetical protein
VRRARAPDGGPPTADASDAARRSAPRPQPASAPASNADVTSDRSTPPARARDTTPATGAPPAATPPTEPQPRSPTTQTALLAPRDTAARPRSAPPALGGVSRTSRERSVTQLPRPDRTLRRDCDEFLYGFKGGAKAGRRARRTGRLAYGPSALRRPARLGAEKVKGRQQPVERSPTLTAPASSSRACRRRGDASPSP